MSIKRNKPTVIKSNYYNFNHEAVDKMFSGGLTFVNDFNIKGEHMPVAVYRVTKPDKKKGHKPFFLIQRTDKGGVVRGMTKRQILKHAKVKALHCLKCNVIVRSVHAHQMHYCGCNNQSFIDGGQYYSRYGGIDISLIQLVTLDLLTDEFTCA